MSTYICWVKVEVGFPIEVEASDEYEAEDIADEQLERIVKNHYKLSRKLSGAVELHELEDYEVLSCERAD